MVQSGTSRNCRGLHTTTRDAMVIKKQERQIGTTTGQTVTCRAAVVWEENKPFTIETVEVAPPQEGEVRVKMCSSGLCHSDLHILQGCDPKYPFPGVLGHEGVGIVESVGQGVKDMSPGDVVIPLFHGYCGDCDFCKSPKTNLCKNQTTLHLQRDKTSRITCKGRFLSQLFGVSTFSEYTVAGEMNFAKINPNAPLKKVCVAGCCIPTGYGAAVKCAQVEAGSTCAIWGLGGIGVNVVVGCRDSKASKIIGIDSNPNKFALAKEFGCTHVINPRELSKPVPEILADMSNGGVDYCFVSVGSIEAMEEAFKSSHPAWGQTVIIGLSDIGDTMRAGIWELLFGRKLKGTFGGSYTMKLEIPHLVEKAMNGQIPLEQLISTTLPLEDINRGYDMLASGSSLRNIIDFEMTKN